MYKYLEITPKSSSGEEKNDYNKNDDVESKSTVNKSSSMEQEMPPAKKYKMQSKFVDKWLEDKEFKDWLSKKDHEDGSVTAFCKKCNCDIPNRRQALVRHKKVSKHMPNFISNTPRIEQWFKLKEEDEELSEREREKKKERAELKLCAFIAHHNLPLSLFDDMIPFLVNTFPDSAILRSVSLSRTKATNIITSVLGQMTTQKLVSKLRATPFSIIMDETTDISVNKQCALAVIFCDKDDQVRSEFLGMYEVNSRKAEDLTNGLLSWLENRQIPLKYFVGFSSDTTNSMVDRNNSVFRHLKERVPHIVCIKCSCHMIHLVASKSCLKLPKSVEDLLWSMEHSHFNRSTVRQDTLKEIQACFKVAMHKTLSPATTRWLSLEACVKRTLEQYKDLKEHFKLVKVLEDPSKISDNILITLNNNFTKVYLEFLSYVLKVFNDFKRLFQSEKALLHQLKPEVEKLIKTLASNYMEFHYVKTTDAYNIEFDNSKLFVPLDDLYLGVQAKASIDELSKKNPEPKNQLDKFKKTCLSFYIEAVKQIRQSFDFSDPLFSIIGQVIDYNRAQKYEIKDLSNVIRRFPNIESDIDVEELHREWKTHAFLDHSQLTPYSNLPVEEYWINILRMKNEKGELLFPNLKKVIMLLLVLPCSNASVEQIFSQLKLIKSDNRDELNTETISALMATKRNIRDARKFEPSKAMLLAKIK